MYLKQSNPLYDKGYGYFNFHMRLWKEGLTQKRRKIEKEQARNEEKVVFQRVNLKKGFLENG